MNLKAAAPIILTGVSVLSSIGAVLLAIYETPKAIERIDNHRLVVDPTGETDISPKEKAIDYGKSYWKTGICLGVSIATGIASCAVSQRRYKGLLISAAGVSTAFAKHKDKVKKIIGEEKAKILDKEIRDEMINKSPEDLTSKKWFYEPISEQCFQMTLLEFYQAKLDANRDIQTCGQALLGDVFPAINKLAPKSAKSAWFYDELCECYGYPWLEIVAEPVNVPGSENGYIHWDINEGRETYCIRYDMYPLFPEVAKNYQYIGVGNDG